MPPGAPATCSAAVRAIWLARPGTRVSKVSAGFSRWRGGGGAAGTAARAQRRAARQRRSPRGGTAAAPWLPWCRRCAAAARRSRAAPASAPAAPGWPASSDSTASMRPAYWARIQSSLNRLGTRSDTTSAAASRPCRRTSARRQRADPGVELLFGQLGRESLAAALPQVGAHCGNLVLWEPPDCRIPAGPADRGYPQFPAAGQSPAISRSLSVQVV